MQPRIGFVGLGIMGKPMAAVVEQFFAALRAKGRGGFDHSGVITFFEDLAGVQVRAQR
jgi:3-hydroxyisobutyrate dehydrogenase-like beta-hydroxyacid dehydrogenase